MRHGKKFNHLSRKAAHRKAMLANMACSLIEHKRIKTTLAKAKALRVYVEPLITKSKTDTTHSRRIVFSYLKQKEAITELFGDVSEKVSERSGGYTRILKLSNRLGDNAQMAFIELVDYNDEYTTNKPKAKRARRTKSKKNDNTNPLVEEAVVVEDVVESNKVDDIKSDDIANKEVAELKADKTAKKEAASKEKKDEVDNSKDKEEKGE